MVVQWWKEGSNPSLVSMHPGTVNENTVARRSRGQRRQGLAVRSARRETIGGQAETMRSEESQSSSQRHWPGTSDVATEKSAGRKLHQTWRWKVGGPAVGISLSVPAYEGT